MWRLRRRWSDKMLDLVERVIHDKWDAGHIMLDQNWHDKMQRLITLRVYLIHRVMREIR